MTDSLAHYIESDPKPSINQIILYTLMNMFIVYFYYLRQGDYVFAWFCLWACEFVCEQDNSKTYGRILMKFSGYV